jgi:5'-nucleotidase
VIPTVSRARVAGVALTLAGLGAVLMAPAPAVAAAPAATRAMLAAQAGEPTLAGAGTLADRVAVDWRYGDRPRRTTDLHVLAWNDFHGNLEPAGLNIYGRFAGGAAYLAKAVHDRQAQYAGRVVTVTAGDNIGASPLANGLFAEEPSAIVANLMRVDFSAVGNHEFDKGVSELLRIQRGGCGPTDCSAAPYLRRDGSSTATYPGADFRYLSANVTTTATGRTLFPAAGTRWLRTGSGTRVGLGFIGTVLSQTPTIVTPSGVAGLTFGDEADAANRAARQLAREGVHIPILIVHQGGAQTGAVTAPNGCAGNLAGTDLEKIIQRLDPSIKVVVSGHTHAEYRCLITTNGVTRLVTGAASFGRILSDLTLTVDDRTGTLIAATAANTIVENALNTPGAGVTRQDDPSRADPTVAGVVEQYVDASAPLANQVVGRIQGDLTRAVTALGEHALGDVIADAQLAATSAQGTGAAQLALMNPGGIRNDLRVSDISSGGEAVGEVTYGEAFTVHSLVTKTMTGDQVRRVLEQQFVGCGGQTVQRVLQISATVTYQSRPTAATCAGKIGEIRVGGAPVTPTGTLRVTMNNFLATGGDGFTVFNEGTDPLGGAQDIDAFVDHLRAAGAGGIAVPATTRITPLP